MSAGAPAPEPLDRLRAEARIDVGAIARNVQRLRGKLAGGARMCAVVKANGYGHGALAAARAALEGGAEWLAVAGAAEAAELRAGGVDSSVPILVMGALGESERATALQARADIVVWRERDIDAVAAAGGGRVHVKLDTGMGRLGTRDTEQASRVAALAAAAPGVELAGVMTHFATADDRGDGGFFELQLDRFRTWAQTLRAEHPHLIVHAANSAATLRQRDCHFDMVRCGVAIYGLDPFGVDPADRGLEPALALRSYVAEVKLCAAGESVGYGRRFVADRDQAVAVLPIGYGDGWRRSLSGNCEVLIGGARWPLVGTVSMDNVTVSLAAVAERSLAPVSLVGAEAVLIGAQGAERITAEEIASRLGTINYEVTCGLTARVPRMEVDERVPAAEPGPAPARIAGARG